MKTFLVKLTNENSSKPFFVGYGKGETEADAVRDVVDRLKMQGITLADEFWTNVKEVK